MMASHPRWLPPPRLARLQGYAAAGTPRWKRLLAAANTSLANPSPNALTDLAGLALASVLTGNAAYGAKAIACMTAYAASVPMLNALEARGYDYRYLAPWCLAYDLCRGQMTPAQVSTLATWAMNNADWVWPETGPPGRAQGWAVNSPSNNYWAGFLHSWMLALVCMGDDPRCPAHLDLARNVKYPAWRAWALGWGAGGAFAEGTSYDAAHYLARILDLHACCTGENLFADVPWWSDSLRWRLHSACPGLVNEWPWGDQAAQGSLCFLSGYDLQRAAPAYQWVNT